MVYKDQSSKIFCVSDSTRENDVIVFICNSMKTYTISKNSSVVYPIGFSEIYKNVSSVENIKTKVSKVRTINDYALSVNYLMEEKLRKLNKLASNYELLMFNLIESLGSEHANIF